jgi:hypothetical protein
MKIRRILEVIAIELSLTALFLGMVIAVAAS